MERIECESFWLGSPALAYEFVGREALEGFEPLAEVIGVDKVGEMPSKLFVIVILIFYSWRRFAGCKALILFVWRGGFNKNVVPRYMRFRLTLW